MRGLVLFAGGVDGASGAVEAVEAVRGGEVREGAGCGRGKLRKGF